VRRGESYHFKLILVAIAKKRGKLEVLLRQKGGRKNTLHEIPSKKKEFARHQDQKSELGTFPSLTTNFTEERSPKGGGKP